MKWFVKPLATIALVLMILGTGGTTLSGKVVHVSKTLYDGSGHTLVVKEDGSLYGIGPNQHGQLGDGTTTNRTEFVQILSSGVATAETGTGHSIFLKKDGSVWGMGGYDSNITTPVQIMSDGVKQIAAGNQRSLFVKTDGSLWSIYASYSTNWTPTQLISSDVESVTVGSDNVSEYIYYVKTDGSLWSHSDNKQIVSSGVQTVSASTEHVLFIKTDGYLWGWGNNNSGQLGVGTTTNHDSPVQITKDGWKVTDISTGGYGQTSLFVDSKGTLFGMGENGGELGLDHVFRPLGHSFTYHTFDNYDPYLDPSPTRVYHKYGESLGLGPNMGSGAFEYHTPKAIVTGFRMKEFTHEEKYSQVGTPLGDSNQSVYNYEPFYNTYDFKYAEDVVSARCGTSNSFFIKNDGTLWFCGILRGPTSEGWSGGIWPWAHPYPVQVILPETTSDSGSSESNSSSTVDASKLNEAWGYFKYPWVYNNSIPSWLYLHATDQGQLLWCEKDQSWYSWDSTTQAWKKN